MARKSKKMLIIINMMIILIINQQVSSYEHVSPVCSSSYSTVCTCNHAYDQTYATCRFFDQDSAKNWQKFIQSASKSTSNNSNGSSYLNRFNTFTIAEPNKSQQVYLPAYLFSSMSIEMIRMFDLKLTELKPNVFAGIKQVASLYLSNSCLKSIDFGSFPPEFKRSLSYLDLSNNFLQSMPDLSEMTELKTVDFSHNHIKHFDFSKLIKSNLQELVLSNNRLTGTIDFSASSKSLKESLTNLYLQYNHIESVENVNHLNKLLTLLLDHNKFKSILRRNFEKAAQLNGKLGLSHNQIEFIEPHSFGDLGQLTQLDLSFNRLRRIESNTLLGLRSLNELGLNDNEIEAFNPNTSDLMTKFSVYLFSLDLSNNRLKNFEYVHNATSAGAESALYLLKLSNNQLERINLANLNTLNILDLRDNQLKEYPKFGRRQLNSLTQMDVSGNQIRRLGHYEAFHNFKMLDSSSSSQLYWLNLSHNHDMVIEANAFKILTSSAKKNRQQFSTLSLYISNSTLLNTNRCALRQLSRSFDRISVYVEADADANEKKKEKYDFSQVCECQFRFNLAKHNILIKSACPRFASYCNSNSLTTNQQQQQQPQHSSCADNTI